MMTSRSTSAIVIARLYKTTIFVLSLVISLGRLQLYDVEGLRTRCDQLSRALSEHMSGSLLVAPIHIESGAIHLDLSRTEKETAALTSETEVIDISAPFRGPRMVGVTQTHATRIRK